MSKLPQGTTDLELFQLGDPYYWGKDFAQELRDKIQGRVIFTDHDAGLLCQMIMNARHGDHVEIGTFFGASAILVAAAKKHFNAHGKIYCVDPLEARNDVMLDHTSEIVATTKIVYENAGIFDVRDRIEIHPHASKPWPLKDRTFATAYIDGDHWNGFPRHDWNALRKTITYSVMFDDYCWGKTEVIETVIRAMSDPYWIPIHISGLSAILRRRH
ncbi:MAG: class I SAM-dependent methyltransferase [Planctomycetes bacterium]|nr:class I SAM-dependent methyltransferase [Planctomycetota bacterium]